jgi:hypothetical protein
VNVKKTALRAEEEEKTNLLLQKVVVQMGRPGETDDKGQVVVDGGLTDALLLQAV